MQNKLQINLKKNYNKFKTILSTIPKLSLSKKTKLFCVFSLCEQICNEMNITAFEILALTVTGITRIWKYLTTAWHLLLIQSIDVAAFDLYKDQVIDLNAVLDEYIAIIYEYQTLIDSKLKDSAILKLCSADAIDDLIKILGISENEFFSFKELGLETLYKSLVDEGAINDGEEDSFIKIMNTILYSDKSYQNLEDLHNNLIEIYDKFLKSINNLREKVKTKDFKEVPIDLIFWEEFISQSFKLDMRYEQVTSNASEFLQSMLKLFR